MGIGQEVFAKRNPMFEARVGVNFSMRLHGFIVPHDVPVMKGKEMRRQCLTGALRASN